MSIQTVLEAQIAAVILTEVQDERFKLRKASTLALKAGTTPGTTIRLATELGLVVTPGNSGETWIGLASKQ